MNLLWMCNGLLLPYPNLLEFVYSQVLMSCLGDLIKCILQVSINSATSICERLWIFTLVKVSLLRHFGIGTQNARHCSMHNLWTANSLLVTFSKHFQIQCNLQVIALLPEYKKLKKKLQKILGIFGLFMKKKDFFRWLFGPLLMFSHGT